MATEWYEINNVKEIISPALAIYPDRIKKNIDSMLEIAGEASRLRPHVKTYKMPEIVQMQMDRGISKFKCATLVEAEMLANTGCKDILIAMPSVGPMQAEILNLKRKYSDVQFSTLIDHISQVQHWFDKLEEGEEINLYIDVNVGMSRTGISPEESLSLIEKVDDEQNLNLMGLHVYDGHNRIEDYNQRKAQVEKEYAQVTDLLSKIENSNKLEVVCGGSVTFPCHAEDNRRTLSPGTTLLWDAGYGSRFPDIPINNAAVLVSRIISMPGEDRICLDLGHKSVASEMQDKRVIFPQLEKYERVGHSEEHLVLKVADRDKLEIGQVLYGIPWHICPTVALHEEVVVVNNNHFEKLWKVEARRRRYSPVSN